MESWEQRLATLLKRQGEDRLKVLNLQPIENSLLAMNLACTTRLLFL